MEVEMEECCVVELEGWETPKRVECRIPVAFLCPPPPLRKKPIAAARRRGPPKNGYFQPPDLELLFALAPRREASCACFFSLLMFIFPIQIKAVRKKKERAKELEGIDLSNIVSSTRRRTTSSFVIPPPKPEASSESDEEDDDEDNEDSDDGNNDSGVSSEGNDEGMGYQSV
ncbi:hypothetical protein Taro_011989 [Colocasia esculenta]|uniref:Histone chaperone domain-containing protein n=1 Tax=Colocasia esculenta TaxID=4460 RepID=A0A843UEC5_COLES|nr:hypothetical protein [Colocasia esculenta]